MLPQQTRIDLLKARDYIREHGWCQGTLLTADYKVCPDGALRMVIGGNTYINGFGLQGSADLIGWNDANRLRYRAAIDKLSAALPPRDGIAGTPWASIHVWNDVYERDIDEVCALFEKAANA